LYASEGDTTAREGTEMKGYLRGRKGEVSYPNEKEEKERRGEKREREEETNRERSGN